MGTLWNVDSTGDLTVGEIGTRTITDIQQNVLPTIYTTASVINANLNTQYVIQNGAGWTLNLPTSSTIGDRIKVTTNFVGGAIQLAGLNYVISANRSTTLGGTVSTSDEGASITLVHDQNFGGQREWIVESITGNWIGSGSPSNFDINAIFDYTNDGAGVQSANFANRVLSDTSAITSVNWATRILYTSTNVPTVQWNIAQLFDLGSIKSLDWNIKVAYDNSAIPSVLWHSRTLKDNGSLTSVDWQARNLYANDGSPNMSYNLPGILNGTSSALKIASLQVVEGSNAKQGTFNISLGALTIANTSVTANSRIFLCSQDSGVVGALRVDSRTPGSSFTVISSVGTDTGVVAYEIFEPA